jgi:hypothetical protein
MKTPKKYVKFIQQLGSMAFIWGLHYLVKKLQRGHMTGELMLLPLSKKICLKFVKFKCM